MLYNFILNNDEIKLNIISHNITNPIKVLIHIHGLFQDFQSTDDNIVSLEYKINELQQLNIISYALELRGHGLSASSNIVGTLDDYVSDLNTLVEYIKNKHIDLPIHIMAHSLGGAVTIKYCIKYKHITSVILLAPLIGVSDNLFAILNTVKTKTVLDLQFNIYIVLFKLFFNKYKKYISKYNNNDILFFLKELYNIIDYIDTNKLLFETPILAIHSKDDSTTSSTKTKKFIDCININNKKIILLYSDDHTLFKINSNINIKQDILTNIYDWLKTF